MNKPNQTHIIELWHSQQFVEWRYATAKEAAEARKRHYVNGYWVHVSKILARKTESKS